MNKAERLDEILDRYACCYPSDKLCTETKMALIDFFKECVPEESNGDTWNDCRTKTLRNIEELREQKKELCWSCNKIPPMIGHGQCATCRDNQ